MGQQYLNWNNIGDEARNTARAYFKQVVGRDASDAELIDIINRVPGEAGLSGIYAAINSSPQKQQLDAQGKEAGIQQEQQGYLKQILDLANQRQTQLQTLLDQQAAERGGYLKKAEDYLQPVDLAKLSPDQTSQLDFLRQRLGEQGVSALSNVEANAARRGITGSSTEQFGLVQQNKANQQNLMQLLSDFINQETTKRQGIASQYAGLAGMSQNQFQQSLGLQQQPFSASAGAYEGMSSLLNPSLQQQYSLENLFTNLPYTYEAARKAKEASQMSTFQKIMAGLTAGGKIAGSFLAAPATGGASLATLPGTINDLTGYGSANLA